MELVENPQNLPLHPWRCKHTKSSNLSCSKSMLGRKRSPFFRYTSSVSSVQSLDRLGRWGGPERWFSRGIPQTRKWERHPNQLHEMLLTVSEDWRCIVRSSWQSRLTQRSTSWRKKETNPLKSQCLICVRRWLGYQLTMTRLGGVSL